MLPGATGLWVDADSFKAGNALTGRGGLSEGQLLMNGEASENTSLSVRGASNGCGKGDSPSPARRYDEWRASTVRMEPAAVRYVFSMMSAAAPRYADTPTPSRMEAVARKLLTSV